VPSIVATIGTMTLFRGAAYAVLGDRVLKNYPDSFAAFGQGYLVGPVSVELALFVVFAVVYALFLHGTRWGRAVFAIGAGMAAASGVLFGPLVGVNHAMGVDWILKAFIVVVVGGMGSLGGSIAASIFISLLEAYASIWVSPAQAVIVSFVVLILTLLFRPTGLFVPTPK